MATVDEIDQIMDRSRLSKNGPSVDFDWFDTIVLSAAAVGVIQYDVEVLEVGPNYECGYLLIVLRNGSRLASKVLTPEEQWDEACMELPVTAAVEKLLEIALREISKIITVHDTWHQPKPVGP